MTLNIRQLSEKYDSNLLVELNDSATKKSMSEQIIAWVQRMCMSPKAIFVEDMKTNKTLIQSMSVAEIASKYGMIQRTVREWLKLVEPLASSSSMVNKAKGNPDTRGLMKELDTKLTHGPLTWPSTSLNCLVFVFIFQLFIHLPLFS